MSDTLMTVEDLATWLDLVDGDEDFEVSAAIRLARSRAERAQNNGFPKLSNHEFEQMFGETMWTEARRLTRERLQAHFEKTGCVAETYPPLSGPLFRAAIDEIVADAA